MTNREDFYKTRRNAFDKEQKRFKRWQKELKEGKKLTGTFSNSTITGHLPGSTLTDSNYAIDTNMSIADSAITINGDPINGSVSIDVPLKVNDRDILKELDEMRDSLLLLKRDVNMEAKYPRLKELKDEYEAALAKYKTFNALKDSK